MIPMFDVQHVKKSFGGVTAVDDVSFSIQEGEIFGVIGPNGAGKTTLFNLLTGFMQPEQGKIYYYQENILGQSPNRFVQKGIVRTFQSTNLFSGKTVLENVMMGTYLVYKPNTIKCLLNIANQQQEEEARTYAEEILEFVGIAEYRDHLVDDLPYGYKRLVGVAISLACKPKVLLLDEPAAGMVQEETERLMEIIQKTNETGVTVVLIEHNMKMVMNICQRIMVLDFGKKIALGIPQEISQDKHVIQAYLGVQA